MTPPDMNTSVELEEQAALWAARLDGDVLEASMRLELDTWLETDPRHRALLSEYCQLSADLETKLTALLSEGRLDSPAIAEPATSRRPHLAWWTWSGGLAAIAATVAIVLWSHRPSQQYESMTTPVAERATHELADGSRIELDARTSVRVEINATRRRMQLADGEVFLAVAKDPSRPFVIETTAGSVRVKGTKFDVRSMGNASLHVTVEEGTVQVNPADSINHTAPVILTAGDQLILEGNNVTRHHLDPQQLADALAWRQGEVVFKGTPLREALACFARHHGIGISADPKVAQMRIGGRYSLDDLNGFFTDLEQTMPVRISRSLSGTYLVSMRSSSITTTTSSK